MTEGTIVTFYSYKGGVGRTFALANVGAALATWGFRVLCIDWDLDAPGLGQYFKFDELRPGLVELITEANPDEPPDWHDYISHITLPTGVQLALMCAGQQDDSYIDALSGESKDIEVFCNQFAAEFLVPIQDFEQRLSPPYNDEFVEVLADHYKVSREVILRRLLDRGLLQNSYYRAKVNQWANEYESHRSGSGGGGNYYYNQITYLGEKYLNLAFGRYYQGRCNIDQLSDYVNVKARNIPTLEQVLSRRATAQ